MKGVYEPAFSLNQSSAAVRTNFNHLVLLKAVPIAEGQSSNPAGSLSVFDAATCLVDTMDDVLIVPLTKHAKLEIPVLNLLD